MSMHEHAWACILHMHATHTHTSTCDCCQYILSTCYTQVCILGRYPDISKIVSIIILIESEHGLTSNASSYWSHYWFIFARCQSILIHLSPFVCDRFVHMNLACDFKPPYGDLLSRKYVHQSFVSAFPCSDRVWGVFSDPLQSLWLGGNPITYSQNPTLNGKNRCFLATAVTPDYGISRAPEQWVCLLRWTGSVSRASSLSSLTQAGRQLCKYNSSLTSGGGSTWNLNVATVAVCSSELWGIPIPP